MNKPDLNLEKILRAKLERPWRYYGPVPKVRDTFHSSFAPYRLLTGPNGGGKTWAGAYELTSYATGYNHIRDEHYPTPNRCWAVATDHINQGPIMQRTLEEMLPKGTRFIEKKMKFVLPEPWKSEIYMKACESGWLKFTGERILAAWFDEEWPGAEGLKIWTETMRRTKPGWPLRMFMTVTPLQGYTWTFDHLWKVGSPKRFQGAESFNFTIYDCAKDKGGFLTNEEIKDAESKCQSMFDRRIRLYGEYQLVGSSPAFPPELLMAALDRSRPGTRYNIKSGRVSNGLSAPIIEEHPEGDLVILVKPKPGREYVLGADPSMGVYRDYSVASIVDREMPVECAYFRSNSMPPAMFARDVIAPLGTYYNNALAAVESNSGAGGATLAHLPGVYGHIYMRQDFKSRDQGFKKEYGFRTDVHSRGLIFSSIRDVLPMDNCIMSEELVRELMDMIVEDDRIDHQDDKHDDHAIAYGIAIAVNKINPKPNYEPWDNYRETYRGDDEWMGS